MTLVQEVAERTWTSVLSARAETDLRESEARFRQFAEHSTDMLWIMNAETLQMEYVSPAFERVWGWSAEMFRHREQWAETLHPDDRERALQATDRVLRRRHCCRGVPHCSTGREHAPHPRHRLPDL